MDGLFITLTNVNFDNQAIAEFTERVRAEREKFGGKPCAVVELWKGDTDTVSLRSTLLFGMKGMAAYAHHAMNLGYTDDAVSAWFYKGLCAVNRPHSVEEWLALIVEFGQVNFRCMELAEFAQAGQLGYMDLPGGVYVNRKVVYIKPDLYVLADEMYTGDRHTYQQYFHFNNHGTVTQNAPGEKKFPCVAYRGKMAEADFYFVSAQVKAELKSGHIARHYNVEEENTVCKVTKQGEGFTSLITVIDAQPGRPLSIEKLPVRSALKQTDYPETMAEALKITAGEKEYVVILCHQEVNSPTDLVEVDGCMGYGNVIVFDKAGDVLVGDVLNW